MKNLKLSSVVRSVIQLKVTLAVVNHLIGSKENFPYSRKMDMSITLMIQKYAKSSNSQVKNIPFISQKMSLMKKTKYLITIE